MKYSLRISYILCIFMIAGGTMAGQNTDPVLFTINETTVPVSEFLYIYGKNNGKEADYSKKSLEEYLDLYKKFKLKVAKAKKLQIDTLPDLKIELNSYKQQVSNSYIMDKEVTERLVREIYNRQKTDVLVKHVFFSFPPNAKAIDTSGAYSRAMKAYADLKNGVPFGKVVQEQTDDKSNINYSGELGYITAMLPDGFYAIENTIYSTPIGEFSAPVKSSAGYHIIKVDDIRPARREMEIAQLLIKKSSVANVDRTSKAFIDSLYSLVQKGGDFKFFVKSFSHDESTKDKEGYIGFIGINQFEKDFEDAIFSIQKDGDFAKPIETRVGWHLIQRISKKEELPYTESRDKIKALVEADSRYEIARNQVIQQIQKENNYVLNQAYLTKLTNALPLEFLSYSWEIGNDLPKDELFKLNNKSYAGAEFIQYMKQNTGTRLQYAQGTPAQEVVPELFNQYLIVKTIEFEENNLAIKYPEFKNLMREYEEGILLFEMTRQAVWDKASQDTLGLNKFFDKNRDRYKWNERALISDYTVHSTDEAKIKMIYTESLKKSVDKITKKYNKISPPLVTYEKDYLEKGAENLQSLNWKANQASLYTIDKEKGIATFRKVEKILAPMQKTLDESRGYAIADYQDYLEKEWISQLQKEFSVQVNKSVLDALVKKP